MRPWNTDHTGQVTNITLKEENEKAEDETDPRCLSVSTPPDASPGANGYLVQMKSDVYELWELTAHSISKTHDFADNTQTSPHKVVIERRFCQS